MHLKGKWGKEKWKKTCGKEKIPGLSRSSKPAGRVAGLLQVHQGGVQTSRHIPPPQSGSGNPEGTGATPALGTKHVPGVGIDETGPRHRFGGWTPRQARQGCWEAELGQMIMLGQGLMAKECKMSFWTKREAQRGGQG